ncbi:MAG: Slp family lipoprotein [Gammaproteobacteria bacterium]|nr:Slp family lipoprotein [Gammaproteobacteria bacterium]MCW8910818.1 Slp family lipoprotein [Gammaproteobacteria bacterium]MCW9004814.1 Slp family lipoprotein [Gammaproteobacteria bacterium]MCW9055838.1 Slp family lipoprotein [Gammaproteobacteria bacterium]
MIRNCHIGSFTFGLFIATLLLSACSSHVPETIKTSPDNNPDFQQVQTNIEKHLSQKVRWGGNIVDIKNRKNESQLSIVAFPLSDNGKPILDKNSHGRFIAVSEKFLEPTVYTKDRQITVVGSVLGLETRNIGEFPYKHILIKMDHHYLWPVENINNYQDYPPDFWWYDPWYPWYPYHPYYPHRY